MSIMDFSKNPLKVIILPQLRYKLTTGHDQEVKVEKEFELVEQYHRNKGYNTEI